MFEIYLNNLYRNLNLYNIQNSKIDLILYKNKIKNMLGGADADTLKKLKDFSQKLKKDMEQLKKKREILPKNENTIVIDRNKFEAMVELIKYSVEQITRDHELVKQSMDRMNTTVESDEFKNIQKTISEVNSMFADLLS
jgi:hypothetical protein